MILIKGNAELIGAFGQLIKIMKINVTWNGLFLIINNNLILPGELRCMFLNLDNKKLTTNVVEVPINEKEAEQITDNIALINAINMVLYAFGKWGVINGLKVEKDYNQLNSMFHSILKEVKIEPNFTETNFRFLKDGIQITYEEVISEVIALKKEKKEEQGEENEQEDKKEGAEESELGLWHNIRWNIEKTSFKKSEKIDLDSANARLGKNFYQVEYECPVCREKLYMVLYPVNREFLIETVEARVYLARAYTCNHCNCYYTPRPGRLLKEGDVYSLKFEEDRKAYEDYKELLGASGTREANYKFNEYESEHNKNQNTETLEETLSNIDAMSQQELSNIKDKMDSLFYPKSEVDKNYDKVVKMLKEKENKSEQKGNLKENESEITQTKSKPPNQDFSVKSIDELKGILLELTNKDSSKENGDQTKEEKIEMVKNNLLQKLKEKYDAHMQVTQRMSPKQLNELKTKIEAEQILSESDKIKYLSQIEEVLGKKDEKVIKEKIENCKGKPYIELVRTMEEIEKGTSLDKVKKQALDTLSDMKKIQGKKEVEQLISNMPPQMDKKQYDQLCEKLGQYKEIDITLYQGRLDEKYDFVEKQEIENLIRKANKKDRNALLRLYNQIKEQNFTNSNAEPFLEKINEKIYDMDEAAIAKICPNLMEVDFKEGILAYEKISAGMFLPEIKKNVLEALDKRLTKLKVDENVQLVKKLRKEIEESVKNYSKLYFYDARKMLKEDTKDMESIQINNALSTYGAERGKYELPILVSDSSFLSNGKEGFVLTMDHIFYNSLFSSGVIDVMSIDSIASNMGIFAKGIYAVERGRKKVKIPNSISSGNSKAFGEVLNNFVNYLKERPESRDIDYLAKEKHDVKCCYRCGYRYKDGNICPKCGYKANK